jgi:hypothetical protein
VQCSTRLVQSHAHESNQSPPENNNDYDDDNDDDVINMEHTRLDLY